MPTNIAEEDLPDRICEFFLTKIQMIQRKLTSADQQLDSEVERSNPIRIKSGEPGFLGFSVPEWLGGVICKPEAFIVPTENNAFSWSFPPDLKPARQLSACNQ